jgi:signal transduction histidine kinase
MAEIELCLEPELPLVPLLTGRFKQALLEMIFNATYALAEKYTSRPQQKGKITITTSTAGDQVELRLADNGAGISPSNINKVFDPFFSTKPVGKGSGQGLSVAHGIIVDKHGGTISVSSMPGEGTVFIITLPFS